MERFLEFPIFDRIMNEIIKAGVEDATLLSHLGTQTFRESHGHSAAEEDIEGYIERRLSPDALALELGDPANHFYICLIDGMPAGYVKLIPDCGHPELERVHITKLERLYILRDYYGSGIGQRLLDQAIECSKSLDQSGMWLYAWTENHRAVAFYVRNGFRIVGHYDFEISPTHSNPNHRMFLDYSQTH